MTFEFDIDGVFGDIWTPVESRVRSKWALDPEYSRFTFASMAHDFDMSGLRRDVVEYIYQEFADPDVLREEPTYKGLTRFLVFLRKVQKLYGVDIVLHTHVYTEKAAEARKAWIDKHILSHLPEARVQIDVGSSKGVVHADVCVEDSVSNILRSPAATKLLATRFHNVNADSRALGLIRVRGFVEMTNCIKEVLVANGARGVAI